MLATISCVGNGHKKRVGGGNQLSRMTQQHRSPLDSRPSDLSSHARLVAFRPGHKATSTTSPKPPALHFLMSRWCRTQTFQGTPPWSSQRFWAPWFCSFAICKNAFGLQGQEKRKIKVKPHCIGPRREFVIIPCSIFYLEAQSKWERRENYGLIVYAISNQREFIQ